MNFAARNNPDAHRRSEDFPARRPRTGWITPTLVGLLCAALLLAAYNHVRGNFHRLRTAVIKPEPVPAHVSPGPGGQHPVQLVRSASPLSGSPEFLSMTLLPGRGMQVFQITATMPGKGELRLLYAPTGEEASRELTGTGDDANGQIGTTFGGAFLAPWAGVLVGRPANQPGMLETTWHGQKIVVPAAHSGNRNNVSTEGLLLTRAAASVQTGVLSDGQWAEALFRPGNFDGAWPSTMEINSRAELTGHAIELMLTAKNTGNSAMPLGLGWKPYFAIPSGERANARLLVPAATGAAIDHRTGELTGRMEPAADHDGYLGHPTGTPLGTSDIDQTYTDIQHAVVSDGPVVELRDPPSGYGLRLTLLSPAINFLRVRAPRNQPWVGLEADTNSADPFGREHPGDESGLRVLKAGESLTWRVRLEIFSLTQTDTDSTLP